MEKKRMAFAGTWYPGTAAGCREQIRQFLTDDNGPAQGDFLVGVVPHAGWVYSGSIACRTIAGLVPADGATVDTVLLFGAHMHPQSEPFLMSSGVVETPLGDIAVDEAVARGLADGISIRCRTADWFVAENTLELQYPFIRYFFPDARIVVCGVAPSNFAPIIGAAAVDSALGLGRTVRVVASTDMTHYGPDFQFTPVGIGPEAVAWTRDTNDAAALAAITQMDESEVIAQGLSHHNMCCPGAVAAAVAAAKKLGATRARVLDYATSYDKTRSDSFVGYAGVLFEKK